MSTFKITTFQSAPTKGKVPISPFKTPDNDDNSFIFQTHETKSLFDLFSIMVQNFILNNPLNIKKPIRSLRNKDYLGELYYNKLNYFILDIDEVTSDSDKHKILNYFKDYKCIIGESRGYNGVDKFTMKGFICCEEIEFNDLKHIIELLNLELGSLCKFDNSMARKATLNAPILKSKILLHNNDGKLFQYNNQAKNNLVHLKDEEIYRINELLNKDITVEDGDTISDICLKIFSNNNFEAIKSNINGSISFKHPSEKKTVGGFFWFKDSPYTMHHNNTVKTFNIFETVRKIPEAQKLMEKQLDLDKELLKFEPKTNVLRVDMPFLNITNDIHNKIDEFLHARNGLFSIKSPMGTGKSTIINHIISEAQQIDMKVLIVTNRVSVAEDFSKKYGIKIYNSDPYEIGDSLVVQFDSLWKYNIKYFDIVIMDEFISLMIHSRNNASNNPLNLNKFLGCFNKKLVIADAFLTGYENFLLNNKQFNLHMIDNTFRDSTSLYSYSNKNHFTNNLYAKAQKEKITVSSTSLSFLNSLKLHLEDRGMKVVTLTADTAESTKKLIYKLFEEESHDKWDVLIYSPTLTVGVSNLNNVYSHFHYDGGLSVDIISSLQMIKRTRKAKEIHIFIDEKKKYVKTSFEQIRDDYIQNIGKVDSNYLFEVDDFGETRLSEIGKKAIKIDVFKNILDFDKKKSFNWLSKYHFLNEPKIVDNKHQHDILSRYVKINKDSEERLRLSKINEYLQLNDLEKYDLIKEDSDRTLKKILFYDQNINATPGVRVKILNSCIKDDKFIDKCRKFKYFYEFTNNLCSERDIKLKISDCMMKNEDASFYQKLLEYKIQYKDIFISTDKKLISVLKECGFSLGADVLGGRGYIVDSEIKSYYMCII